MKKTRQSTLHKFIRKSSSDESEDVSVYLPSPSKTAAAEKFSWTRVKSRKQMTGKQLQLFDVADDIQWDKNLQKVHSGANRDLGETLFDPDEYKGQNETLTFQRHSLDEAALLDYAERASALRSVFKTKADVISKEETKEARPVEDLIHES